MLTMKFQIILVVALFIAKSGVRSAHLKPIKRQVDELTDPCATIRCGYYASCQDGQCICLGELCSTQDEPVCGSDGVTYSNECSLQLASCNNQAVISVQYSGPCEDPNPCAAILCGFYAQCKDGRCICPTLCTEQYEPVCGSDGNTYSNECKLQVQSCRHRVFLTVASAGECDDTGCPKDSPPVQCLVNPCEVTKCEAFPGAKCEANYCGGCNAIFRDENGDIVDCDNPCYLPVVPGPCKASISRWYFNIEARMCKPFTYGGCGGNANNFEKKSDCKKECARERGRGANNVI